MPTRVLNGNASISLLPHTHEVFSLPPRVFGCIYFIHNLGPQVWKLDNHAVKEDFLGYSPT